VSDLNSIAQVIGYAVMIAGGIVLLSLLLWGCALAMMYQIKRLYDIKTVWKIVAEHQLRKRGKELAQ